eukprot:390395_1
MFTSSAFLIIALPLIQAADYTYVGCFVDSADRALRYGPYNFGYTIESCYTVCASYKYFALQYNGWCSCENVYDEATKHGPATNCPDNKLGGTWANDLFRIYCTPTYLTSLEPISGNTPLVNEQWDKYPIVMGDGNRYDEEMLIHPPENGQEYVEWNLNSKYLQLTAIIGNTGPPCNSNNRLQFIISANNSVVYTSQAFSGSQYESIAIDLSGVNILRITTDSLGSACADWATIANPMLTCPAPVIPACDLNQCYCDSTTTNTFHSAQITSEESINDNFDQDVIGSLLLNISEIKQENAEIKDLLQIGTVMLAVLVGIILIQICITVCGANCARSIVGNKLRVNKNKKPYGYGKVVDKLDGNNDDNTQSQNDSERVELSTNQL